MPTYLLQFQILVLIQLRLSKKIEDIHTEVEDPVVLSSNLFCFATIKQNW